MLSTVWNPQRGSQSYTEKRRGRKETEVARKIKRGIKRRETDPAIISSLRVLQAWDTQRDLQSWVEKRRGREEIEATWWRKRRVQRGREPSSQ